MIKLIHIGSVALCILSVALFIFSGFYMNRDADAYGPEIHMDKEEIAVSIHDSDDKLLKGVTATDKKDGDVTDTLLIESKSLFMEPGKRKITIDAFDNNHNVTKAVRVIRYKDYVSPRIQLSEPLRAPINNINMLMDYITVEDCLEGEITDALQITPKKELSSITLPGEYDMKLTVSNSVGDVVEIPVTVELYDHSADHGLPKAILSEYLIYTKVGETIEPSDYLIGVNLRGTRYIWDEADLGAIVPYTKSQFDIENNVDTEKPGVYEVVYSVEDKSDNIAKVRMFVVVEE